MRRTQLFLLTGICDAKFSEGILDNIKLVSRYHHCVPKRQALDHINDVVNHWCEKDIM